MGESAAIQRLEEVFSASLCVPKSQVCPVMVVAEINNSAHQNGNGTRDPFSVRRMSDGELVIFGRTNGIFHVWLAKKTEGDYCIIAHPVGNDKDIFLVSGTFRDLVGMVVQSGSDKEAPRLLIAAVKGKNKTLLGQDRHVWVGLNRFLSSNFDFWVDSSAEKGTSALRFSNMTAAGKNGKKK